MRGLAREAAGNDLINKQSADGIRQVKGVKSAGQRMGTWLNWQSAQTHLDAPDVNTLKGMRDQATLAILLACGLRRAKAAALTFGHLQQRDARWVVVDLVGKGRRVRSVPIPSWMKAAIDRWAVVAGVSTGRAFRSLRKGARLDGLEHRRSAMADVLAAYGGPIQSGSSWHDLRRTLAKVPLTGHARLEHIQLSRGHASIVTTGRYLGARQDLTDAV